MAEIQQARKNITPYSPARTFKMNMIFDWPKMNWEFKKLASLVTFDWVLQFTVAVQRWRPGIVCEALVASIDVLN